MRSKNVKGIFRMKVELYMGDITTLTCDAIVNAANSSLLGGGGVDGAIHKAGGAEILEACKRIRSKQGGCKTGEAVITTAGKLDAKYVIHTVGPVWEGGSNNEEALLRKCYGSVLRLASQNRIKTVAIPNISTGVYRFPKQLAARIAIDEVGDFLNQNDSLEKVVFVCYDKESYEIYKNLLRDHF